MDVKRILKLDLTLAKLSSISASINFWEMPNVKLKIRDIYLTTSMNADCGLQAWVELIEYVAKPVDSLCFPAKLIEDIKGYVHLLGEQMFHFLYHIKNNDFDINFGLKIYWTSFGTVDELRMVRNRLKYSSQEKPLKNCFLSLASVYTDIDLIRHNMRQINEDIVSYLTLMDSRQHLRTSGKEKKDAYRANFYEPQRSFSAVEKFRVCFQRAGFLFAARHIWKELSIDQKKDNVTYAAEQCLRLTNVSHISYSRAYYFHQQKTELLIFFMKQMSSYQMLTFVSDNFALLFERLLDTWPHQEVSVNIIDNMNNTEEFISLNLERYIWSIISPLANRRNNSLMPYKNRNVYHVILRKFLEKTPEEVIKCLKNHANCLHNLHECADYMTLFIIGNYVSLEGIGSIMKNWNMSRFKEYVLSGNYNELNKFMEYVLTDEEEQKSFKRKLNCINDLVLAGKVELAIENLKWLCNTESERKEIFYIEIHKLIYQEWYDLAEKLLMVGCDDEEERKYVRKQFPIFKDAAEYFMLLLEKKGFDAANHYLTWQFKTEEERRNFKEVIYKSDEWLRDKCYEIWRYSYPYSKSCLFGDSTTSGLLNFFLESDEAVDEFRKNVLFHPVSFLKSDAKNLCCYVHGEDDCFDFMKNITKYRKSRK